MITGDVPKLRSPSKVVPEDQFYHAPIYTGVALLYVNPTPACSGSVFHARDHTRIPFKDGIVNVGVSYRSSTQ